MGETLSLFEPSFNGSVRVETRSERLSGDGGFLLLREVLDDTGLIDHLVGRLHDPRCPERVVHSLPELLREAVAMIAQGWGDQSDAQRLRDDPLLALAGSDRRGVAAAGKTLASQSTFSRLLDLLAQPCNQAVIDTAALELATRRRAAAGAPPAPVMTVDVDGLPLAAPGAQAAAWIPKLVATLRERGLARQVRCRLDAGFTDGATLEALDQAGIAYLGRLRDNAALDRHFDPHRRRGPGRPAERPREWTEETGYGTESWQRKRRVVMVIQEHPAELFRRCFYIVTNLPASTHSGEQVLALYRRRGKAEGHMGEFKDTIGTSLPCTSRGRASEAEVFARAQALLSLRLLAYELLHVLRAQMEAATGRGWSLRRLRERVLKAAARVQRHARRLHVILERRAATLWRKLLGRRHRWRLAA
ncbi:transposase [Spiribacter sp. 2438]|uniref:transposase n=1 Tax=Spiribacter sp. 2438 TaxID=2666185 RepID=UPI0012AF65DB|nr:transposase [Spiribacter sp. 2438]QGM22386.1 transposase [Spiribacter sp. 2438]